MMTLLTFSSVPWKSGTVSSRLIAACTMPAAQGSPDWSRAVGVAVVAAGADVRCGRSAPPCRGPRRRCRNRQARQQARAESAGAARRPGFGIHENNLIEGIVRRRRRVLVVLARAAGTAASAAPFFHGADVDPDRAGRRERRRIDGQREGHVGLACLSLEKVLLFPFQRQRRLTGFAAHESSTAVMSARDFGLLGGIGLLFLGLGGRRGETAGTARSNRTVSPQARGFILGAGRRNRTVPEWSIIGPRGRQVKP